MLQLQRASAGSGKTYTLAKKFIWFLITVKDGGKPVRLRTDNEISAGVSQILAITFTNKATNEMKQRIIDKLAALAEVDDPRKATAEKVKKTDYLADYSHDLGVSPDEVGRACRVALSALLNQYSDFNVSTIDSFFQTVLRTFAYESDLNDSYQLEIDSDYIATSAVDATLDEINNAVRSQAESAFWIDILMKDASKGSTSQWNVFQKDKGTYSIYKRLKDSLLKMESEEYKENREKLDEYLDTENGSRRLVDAYMRIRKDMETEAGGKLSELKKLAKELESLLRCNGLRGKDDYYAYADGHLKKIAGLEIDEKKKPFTPLKPDKAFLKKNVRCADARKIEDKAAEMYAAFSDWWGMLESDRWRLWRIYAPQLPYLGLLLEARKKIKEILDAGNLLQIGETNSMLNRIIGDSDTPFVYERLGTSINHYLIDEFQDTSRLQWKNLSHLVHESEGRGEDNLVIGDAKQSIYRFRNADPSLITTVVPEEFDEVDLRGVSVEENTNWRSDRIIVEFNNFFFRALAEEMAEIQEPNYAGISKENLNRDVIDFRNLYGNVVQHPSHREKEGYVELRFISKPPKSEEVKKGELKKSSAEEDDSLEQLAMRNIGSLVASLLNRGYQQKNIAILVGSHSQGHSVIDALVDYNSRCQAEEDKISFISEESLLISSSEAVGIIVSVLEKLMTGVQPGGQSARSSRNDLVDNQEGKEGNKEGKEEKDERIRWRDIKSDFMFFALRHPDMSPHDQITTFLKEEKASDVIGKMISGMQTVALPALVEAIVEQFVPVDLRKAQAVFIAGFQDLVVDYCSRYPSDVASFMEWWNVKGVIKSITSPEDTDAVQVMTIHKSKGLEFDCVILPFEAGSIPPLKKSEWRWVAPSVEFDGYDLPDWLPVVTEKDLLDTGHADVYREYHDMYMMDRLNTLYVAFTRAKSELYVLTKDVAKRDNSSAWFLKDICTHMVDHYPAYRTDLVSESDMAHDEAEGIITFGQKKAIVAKERKIVENPEDGSDITMRESKVVGEYGVNTTPSILHCLEGEERTAMGTDSGYSVASLIEEEEDETETVSPESADADPRSEGNLLHAIMEKVRTGSDLGAAVMSLRMRGLLTRAQAEEWEPMLREAISGYDVSHWFSPEWRVLNERNIIFPDRKTQRPDRILVSKEGDVAIIVDYKFGEAPSDDSDRRLKAYRRQVSGYVDSFRRASGIGNVKGYVWYVRSGRIYPV